MSKRSPRPQGMSWLSPYLIVQDPGKTIAFYQKAFGFEKKEAMTGADGKVMHAEMVWKDVVIMMGPEGGPGQPCRSPATSGVAPAVQLYLYCDDVDALHKRAVAAGAASKQAPQEMFWGDRICSLADPDGHVWNFATNVSDFDPGRLPQ